MSLTGADAARVAAYKTVETFADITRRRIVLRNGPTAQNVGNAITIPFGDSDFYALVERQISYILFSSDALARSDFANKMSDRIRATTGKTHYAVDRVRLDTMILTIVDTLEAYRVNSLWGLLYEGSRQRILSRAQQLAERDAAAGQGNLATLFACEAAGVESPSDYALRFRSYFRAALDKVERRGFSATLAVARWLITQLATEIVRTETSKPDTVNEQGKVRASSEDWAQAMQKLVQRFGELGPQQATNIDCYLPVQHLDLASKHDAQKKVAASLELDMSNESQVTGFVQGTSAEMDEVVERTRQVTNRPAKRDAWLKRGVHEKVIFEDVLLDPAHPTELPESTKFGEDYAVKRLRAVFIRKMGRVRSALAETGTEIDIERHIANLAGHTSEPCFRHERLGRGFRCMVLVDGSRSMRGQKTEQAASAVRILRQALDFPFVSVDVWGFCMTDYNEVTIRRYDRKCADLCEPDGMTPLYAALNIAQRTLYGGGDSKHIFLLTDGAPSAATSDKKHMPLRQAISSTRNEVRRARGRGISITSILIGEADEKGELTFEIGEPALRSMFGHRRHWSYVTPEGLGEELVRQVTSSFVNYLAM